MVPARTRQKRQQRTATFSPKVDAYGTVKAGHGEYKARVINYAPGRLAIFRDIAPTAPLELELTGEVTIKGRQMRTTFLAADTGEEVELLFQKAGCGCETPRNLRGGRNSLLAAGGVI